jgi:anti-sigma factor RsiW
MTCRELADFLMAYLDDELAPESRAIFEYHLSRCTNCVHYLYSYEQVVLATKDAFAETEHTLAPVPEELVQAILAARRSG